MKPFLLLALAASLAANAYLVLRPATSPAPITHNQSPLTPHASNVPTFTPADWENLQSGQPEIIARLKQLGLPLSLIRRIARAQIDAQFADRQRAIDEARNNFPYWRETHQGKTRFQFSNLEANAALRREKLAALQALLGPDYEDPLASDNRHLAYLPAEKALKLSRLSSDYFLLREPYRNWGTSITFPEDREKLAYLEKQERADLTALLTPEELRAYDLRNAPTARQIAMQTRFLQPTEQEYLAIFDAQRVVDEQFPRNIGRIPAEQAAALGAAQKEADAKIKTALGDERYADYERSKDFNYRQLHELGQRLQLPVAQINAAHDYAKTLDTRSREIISSSKTSPTELAAQLDALSAEATQTLKQHLGPDGFAAYAKTSYNLSNIQSTADLLRKAPPAPAPKPGS